MQAIDEIVPTLLRALEDDKNSDTDVQALAKEAAETVALVIDEEGVESLISELKLAKLSVSFRQFGSLELFTMLSVAVEGVALNKLHSFNSKNESSQHTLAPFVQACSLAVTEQPKIASHRIDAVKVCATRRRIAYSRTETYVLLEPGKDEIFVTEEELKARLTYWLENWPGKALPRDLARFATIHEAVFFLVTSVCELELEGNVGSLQWYEVRLE
ncbi:hypothetical protein EZV62_006788 [Acer yangbiense]|uniref:Uncharacterized protein n=1 Tax=Acer yangbiense TaxID=1000413 RepID=A0A5C7I7G3_9ROSI|nr:hypothetical protein EZV62_006788 [Acer yangbiense]